MPNYPQSMRKFLPPGVTPFGEVFPQRPNPPNLPLDGRTIALKILKQYFAELGFFRMGAPNQSPIGFRIPARDIYIEWPDDETKLQFPSIVMMGAPADYEVIGLTAYVEEDTRDIYQKGTVLQWQAEYTELIEVEIWTNTRAERRAVIAGIETAMSPTEQLSGLRFKMPDYYNELVCFTLMTRELIDNPDSARGRRNAKVSIHMRFNVVALVNATDLRPIVETVTDVDLETGIEIDLTAQGDDEDAG